MENARWHAISGTDKQKLDPAGRSGQSASSHSPVRQARLGIALEVKDAIASCSLANPRTGTVETFHSRRSSSNHVPATLSFELFLNTVTNLISMAAVLDSSSCSNKYGPERSAFGHRSPKREV